MFGVEGAEKRGRVQKGLGDVCEELGRFQSKANGVERKMLRIVRECQK